MKVRSDNARGCFWVESASNLQFEHYVDLSANKGQGECGCDNWKYRCSPRIAAGGVGVDVWCSHVKAARQFLVKDLPPMSVRDRERVISGVIKQWVGQEK